MPKASEHEQNPTVELRMDSANDLKKYLKYLSHPWQIMWRNFLAGAFHGLGFALGTAVLLGFIGFFVKDVLGNLPFFENMSEALELWLEQHNVQ